MSRYKLEFNKKLYYYYIVQLECNMHDFVFATFQIIDVTKTAVL